MPIIPTSISTFLADLFEIFNYVATLTCQQLNLTECHLTYLQYGLYMLFNRLYGMYPVNFIDYIRSEYIAKPEKTSIFNHTIRGLLDTVKIHPNLITSTKATETTTSRFKKMEPHDVVVECAKYSVDNEKSVSSGSTGGFLDCSHMKPLEYTHLIVDPLPPLPSRSYLASAKTIENKFESIWSPSLVIQATPPPTAGTNLTNTPSQTPVPNWPNKNTSNAVQQPMVETEDNTRLVEAAIEATPEPDIRNVNTFRPFVSSASSTSASSQTARNIWPKSNPSLTKQQQPQQHMSTPSSPLNRKDIKLASSQQHQQIEHSMPMDFATNHKLMRILSDREHQHMMGAEPMMISREDQEVNDINSFNINNSNGSNNATALDPDIFNTSMVDYDESSNTDDDDDATPPLYNRVDYVRRVKRLRLYSHCIYSAGMYFIFLFVRFF